MSAYLCMIHDVPEDDAGAHRVCGECGHVFLTLDALLDAVHAEDLQAHAFFTFIGQADPAPPVRPAAVALVHSCPHCWHDW